MQDEKLDDKINEIWMRYGRESSWMRIWPRISLDKNLDDNLDGRKSGKESNWMRISLD